MNTQNAFPAGNFALLVLLTPAGRGLGDHHAVRRPGGRTKLASAHNVLSDQAAVRWLTRA
jgi:hypothetical protein